MKEKQFKQQIEYRFKDSSSCEMETLSVLNVLGIELNADRFSEHKGNTVLCYEEINRFAINNNLKVRQSDYGLSITFWK